MLQGMSRVGLCNVSSRSQWIFSHGQPIYRTNATSHYNPATSCSRRRCTTRPDGFDLLDTACDPLQGASQGRQRANIELLRRPFDDERGSSQFAFIAGCRDAIHILTCASGRLEFVDHVNDGPHAPSGCSSIRIASELSRIRSEISSQ